MLYCHETILSLAASNQPFCWLCCNSAGHIAALCWALWKSDLIGPTGKRVAKDLRGTGGERSTSCRQNGLAHIGSDSNNQIVWKISLASHHKTVNKSPPKRLTVTAREQLTKLSRF